MRYLTFFACILCLNASARAETDSKESNGYAVAKVNHELIDKDNYTTAIIGNEMEKAKYQVSLEKDPNVKGMRFAIHWKAPSSGIARFMVKLYAHGYDAGADTDTVITLFRNYTETPGSGGWTYLDLKGGDWKRLGKLMSWKVVLLQDFKPVAERHSFTWDESILTSQNPNETK